MLLKPSFYRFFVLFLVILSAPSALYAQTPHCEPIATVFDKTICRHQVSVEQDRLNATKQQQEEKQAPLNSEEALQERRKDRLKDIVWQEALRQKFPQNLIDPTEEEILAYTNILKKSLDTHYAQNKKNVAHIKEILLRGEQNKADEIRLQNLLQTLQTSISFYEEREKYNANMPPEFHDMIADAESTIAKAMIAKWKADKALYQEYGGQILIRDGVLIPIEANKKFIFYIYNQGKFEIYEDGFQNLFAKLESAQNGDRPATITEIKNYFGTPPWQMQ